MDGNGVIDKSEAKMMARHHEKAKEKLPELDRKNDGYPIEWENFLKSK
jgi:hypothetical protein